MDMGSTECRSDAQCLTICRMRMEDTGAASTCYGEVGVRDRVRDGGQRNVSILALASRSMTVQSADIAHLPEVIGAGEMASRINGAPLSDIQSTPSQLSQPLSPRVPSWLAWQGPRTWKRSTTRTNTFRRDERHVEGAGDSNLTSSGRGSRGIAGHCGVGARARGNGRVAGAVRHGVRW